MTAGRPPQSPPVKHEPLDVRRLSTCLRFCPLFEHKRYFRALMGGRLEGCCTFPLQERTLCYFAVSPRPQQGGCVLHLPLMRDHERGRHPINTTPTLLHPPHPRVPSSSQQDSALPADLLRHTRPCLIHRSALIVVSSRFIP